MIESCCKFLSQIQKKNIGALNPRHHPITIQDPEEFKDFIVNDEEDDDENADEDDEDEDDDEEDDSAPVVKKPVTAKEAPKKAEKKPEATKKPETGKKPEDAKKPAPAAADKDVVSEPQPHSLFFRFLFSPVDFITTSVSQPPAKKAKDTPTPNKEITLKAGEFFAK